MLSFNFYFLLQMADSCRALAQDPVLCEFCKSTNAELVCQVCYDRVCGICEKVHQNIHSNSEIQPAAKLGKIQGFCRQHPRQRYEVSCYECRVPVCTTCIIEDHNKHKMVNVSVLYEEDKASIVEDISEIRNRIFPTIDIIAHHARAEKENIPSKCEMVADYIKIRVEKTKRMIDEVYSETLKELEEMKIKDVKIIDEHIANIDEILSKLQNTATLYESQLNSRFESDLILFRLSNPGISNLRAIPDTLLYSPPVFKGGKSEKSKVAKMLGDLKPSVVKQGKHRKIRQISKKSESRAVLVSALGQMLLKPPSLNLISGQIQGNRLSQQGPSNPPSRSTSLTKSAKCLKDFKRNFSVMTSVNCVSPTRAWISGQHSDIKLMDLESGECDNVSTDCLDIGPSDVTATADGFLLFSSFDKKSVTRLSTKTKCVVTTFNTDWNPKGLCVGINDEVFVCLVENQFGKVAKYNKEGDMLFEYTVDVDGNRIFAQPSYICRNSYSDICVSDTEKHAVIAVDACGNRKFEFKRKTADDRSSFDPRGLDTDVDNNIAIVDYGNHEIILINDRGDFLTCLLERNDGLSRPCDVSVDVEKKLWVVECRTGRLKVFQSFSSEI